LNIKDIKENFIQYKNISKDSIEKIKTGNFQSPKELHKYIYPYILGKYMLYGTVDDVFSLNKLSELSVARAIRLSEEGIKKIDNPATCEGTTSAMNKKVLLLMAIQKELNFKFPIEIIANIETTMDLADAVYKALKGMDSSE
jgi:hypothetical protein